MINLADYGFIPSMITTTSCAEKVANCIPARVIAAHKKRYELICEYGHTFGRLKTAEYYGGGEEFPTTGDFVLIDNYGESDCRIIKTLERKSKFIRSNFSGHAAGYAKTILEQIIAANFDYVFILQSLNHDLNNKRLERYLTLSWQSGAIPVIILTKADLINDCDESEITEKIRAIEKIAIGVCVYSVSSKSGYGLNLLSEYLKPKKTIVFLGSSGVGKSSLVNALAGEKIMTVNEIREDDSKGRHTTTHRQLIMLKSGVMIIDTPGMRELGMWDATEGIEQSFADVEQYFNNCRFSDCKHNTEPGCAIKAAIKNGELSFNRWNSYLQIKQETKIAENKSKDKQSKKEKGKIIAKISKELKKNGKLRK